MAQQDGQAVSPLTLHTFLVRWLATAQKQRRFPRTVAPDIDSLLRLGRQKGPAAGLYQRLDYLWQSCSGSVKRQSDLFRLTYALETLKSRGWLSAVITDDEWVPQVLASEYAGVSALLVRKSELTRNFSDEGRLLAPVSFLVTGDVDGVHEAFHHQTLPHTLEAWHSGSSKLVLLPVGDNPC